MKMTRLSQANWLNLFTNIDAKVVDYSYHQLIELYSQEHRHYHNLAHINDCLLLFDQIKVQCQDPKAVEIAIWCHDIIYDPLRQDNEEKSAQWISAILNAAEPPIQNAQHIAHLIEATTSHTAYDTDSQILNDIDFAILGAPTDEYYQYSQAIRQEYSHVPDNLYIPARQAVLNKILSTKPLFNTIHFIDKYEQQAKRNLKKEIRSLQSSL